MLRTTLAVIALLVAQTPLAFDVVSVKKTAPGATGGGFQNSERQFMTRNYAIRSLIVLAYGGAGYQIADLPPWTDSERYDIEAKAPDGNFTSEQRREMIRSLLADRFSLRTHRETRDLPVYALVVAKSDGKLGPSLMRSSLDCVAIRAQRAAAGRGPTTPAQLMECGFLTSNGPGGVRLRAQGVSIADLAGMLRNYTDKPVIDKSGLGGGFDLDVTFLSGRTAPLGGDNSQGTAPFVFTAVQDQLGLKLESTDTPMDMLVIDSIERPTEN